MSHVFERSAAANFASVDWLGSQLSFDFQQEISDYLSKNPIARQRNKATSKDQDWLSEQLGLDFEQSFDGELEGLAIHVDDDPRPIVEDDCYRLDDETIANWVANLGPFDLARAMLLEAVRDLHNGSKEDQESARNWINSPNPILGFETCVQWLTDLCVPPHHQAEISLPPMQERVEHLRQMCFNRPLEVLHLLKNFEDWSQYSKMKLEAIRRGYEEPEQKESSQCRAATAYRG